MPKQNELYLHRGHNTMPINFTSADTTVAKLIFQAGIEDVDWKVGIAVSDDTAIINFRIYTRRSGVNYPLGCIRIAPGSGTDGLNPSVNLLGTNQTPGLALDQVFKPYMIVKAGDSIFGAPLATITATKTLTVTCAGHDF